MLWMKLRTKLRTRLRAKLRMKTKGKRGFATLALLLAALLGALPTSAVGEVDERAISALREALTAAPYGVLSQNEARPFEPVEMRAADFDPTDRVFLERLGIDEVDIDSIASGIRDKWVGELDGETVTLVYGEYWSFLFRKEYGGTEKLIDVLATGDLNRPARLLMLWPAQPYLLVTVTGHGTGTWREWTCLYNLSARRMELIFPRFGMENDFRLTAETVTHTNVDNPLDVIDAPTQLMTYTYTAVSELTDDGYPAGRILLQEDCTVRVYDSRDGGLTLAGVRTFEGCSPAMIERMSADELLHGVGMGAQNAARESGEASGEQASWQAQVYHPDDGWVGERLTAVAPDGTRTVCWDQLYPADWYGEERVQNERGEVLRRATEEGLLESAPEVRVVNAEWVNLRQRDSKASPALAAIDESDSVYILRERCGEDSGWTRVYVVPGDGGPSLTGYIWFSFLEKVQ